MPSKTLTLSSFTKTNTDMGAGATFSCSYSGSAISGAYVTSASLYFSSMKTYVSGCYLDFSSTGFSGSTSSFSSNSTVHGETVSVSGLSAGALTATSGTITFTVRRSSGGSGNALNLRSANSGTLTINYEYTPTACGAPTACSVNSTLSEGNVTLSWSGAAAGTVNSISSYEIQYSESSNNSAWSAWAALTTVTTTATSGSVSVAPSGTRGYYRRYQVRTRGSAGASYYSGWKVSSNSVRKATLPTAPTACSLSSTLSEGNVTLSWSGAANGNGHSIASYEIQYSESSNNSSWGAWTALTTVTSTATSGSVSVAPSGTRGYYRRFQVRAIPSTGASYASAWRVSSNTLRRNTAPTAPTSFTINPTVYWHQDVTLSWSGAASGTSAISKYEIQYCTSTDNATWGSWVSLVTLTSSATSGSFVATPSQTAGTYTKYRIRATDTLSVSSGYKESSSILMAITACGAPTACSVNTTLTEGNVTLSWSGATSGSGNTISGYEVQYSDSVDNTTWDSWTALTVITSTASSGSLSVAPSSTRGTYRRFRVLTRGSAGASYYSSWKVSNNSVRKNVLPSPPTVFTALPELYEVNNVTLTWSGTKAGTSAIVNSFIQFSVSTNGGAWSAYEMLQTITGTATSGEMLVNPSDSKDVRTRYRIAVTDALGAVSSYKVSNIVSKLSPPAPPVVISPKAGSTIYNPHPRFLLRGGASYSLAQAICVQVETGKWEDSARSPEHFSPSGYISEGGTVIYWNEEMDVGTKKVSFRAFAQNIEIPGDTISSTFTFAPLPEMQIVVSETKVQAAHTLTLRTAVNDVRNYYGMAAFPWGEQIVPKKTPIRNWTFHVLELRKAIDEIVEMISAFVPDSDFLPVLPDWLPLSTTRPSAAVMHQILEVIGLL